MPRARILLSAAAVVALVAGCNRAAETVESAGETVAEGAEAVAEGAADVGESAVSLVNVNLSNVLNDIAIDLSIDRANIPINAQIPITIAANVCGVSINILSASVGNRATCTATSVSPELVQAIRQQLATEGSVGEESANTSADPTNETEANTNELEHVAPDTEPDRQLH